jgi:hypothetical protein
MRRTAGELRLLSDEKLSLPGSLISRRTFVSEARSLRLGHRIGNL